MLVPAQTLDEPKPLSTRELYVPLFRSVPAILHLHLNSKSATQVTGLEGNTKGKHTRVSTFILRSEEQLAIRLP